MTPTSYAAVQKLAADLVYGAKLQAKSKKQNFHDSLKQQHGEAVARLARALEHVTASIR